MDDNSLSSVLDESAPQEEQIEQTEVEQIEQVAEVTDSGEQETAPPAETQEDEGEKRQKGLEAALLAERRKRQEFEQRLAQYEQQRQPQQQHQADKEPQESEFATQQEYLRALAKFEARQIVAQERAEAEKERLEQQERDRLNEIQRHANETVSKGQAKYKDFDSVINDGLGPFLNQQLQQALLMSEQGHEVAYWLGKNPAEAARVAQLPPMAMVRELAFIETKLQAQPAQQKPSIPQTLTQARDARGQFQAKAYDGPTPLDAIVARR